MENNKLEAPLVCGTTACKSFLRIRWDAERQDAAFVRSSDSGGCAAVSHTRTVSAQIDLTCSSRETMWITDAMNMRTALDRERSHAEDNASVVFQLLAPLLSGNLVGAVAL